MKSRKKREKQPNMVKADRRMPRLPNDHELQTRTP